MGQILDGGFYGEKNGEAAFAHKQAHACAHMSTWASHAHACTREHNADCIHNCTHMCTHTQAATQTRVRVCARMHVHTHTCSLGLRSQE